MKKSIIFILLTVLILGVFTACNGDVFDNLINNDEPTPGPVDPKSVPLTLEFLEEGELSFECVEYYDVKYSINGGEKITATDDSIQVPAGAKIQLYANRSSVAGDNYLGINCSSEYCVYGNIMSLISEDNYENTETVFPEAFRMLFFYEEKLKSAENLILPATTLADSCYYDLFAFCTNLTSAPALPSTTLVEGCYKTMFYGCVALDSITCLATDISADKCTYYWVSDVFDEGTFTRHDSSIGWTVGYSGYPTGWELKDYYKL